MAPRKSKKLRTNCRSNRQSTRRYRVSLHKQSAKRRKSAKRSKRRKSVKRSKRRKSVKRSKRRKSAKRSKRRKSAKRSKRRKSAKRSKRRKSVKRSKRRRKSKRSKRRKSAKQCEEKWKTLEHNGVIFPMPYKHLSIPLLYGPDKKPIMLNGEAEEAAMFYAKILHLDHSTNPTFRKNFFADWKKLLPRGTSIKSLDQCDFKNFKIHVDNEAADRKAMTRSTKSKAKEAKERAEAKYTTATVNGKKQSVGNFRVEPPGLFLGRGKHPKAGKIKRRIQPEDIIINIGKDAKVPTPPPGHQWGQIIHDKCSVWLASWKENINNDTKYVWLGQDADIKKKSDEAKFELARELKNNFQNIRDTNMNNIMISGSSIESEKLNQLAVALYLIDTLVLRVGNEKGSDEADTVGVASLRVEHIKVSPNNMITLDFLGKDSVRFVKTFKVPERIHQLLKEFTKSKSKNAPLFNLITAKNINDYLKELMPGLTAKVFRTANASNLYQQELDKIKTKKDEKVPILINKMNKANAEVAIMCNHKKKVSKNFDAGIDKIKEQIKTAKHKIQEIEAKSKQTEKTKEQIKKAKAKIKELNSKLTTKKQMKEVAIGTSKINYIDPRITVAFGKKHDIDVSKLFNAVQRKKFEWAMDVGPRWKF